MVHLTGARNSRSAALYRQAMVSRTLFSGVQTRNHALKGENRIVYGFGFGVAVLQHDLANDDSLFLALQATI